MITIDYFSDVLCVWAYGGQIRLDELEQEFGERVLVRQHFMELFADTGTRIGTGWKDQGGFEGFGRHLVEVCDQWEHTHLSPDVWTRCRPISCVTAHVFLKAAGLCLGLGDSDEMLRPQRAKLDKLVREVRLAFFERAEDISDLAVLMALLPSNDIRASDVRRRIDNGEAYAALNHDTELARQYGVLGSPTYVFNEGRQLLYGNVGYRIIESNVRELLTSAPLKGAPSWC